MYCNCLYKVSIDIYYDPFHGYFNRNVDFLIIFFCEYNTRLCSNKVSNIQGWLWYAVFNFKVQMSVDDNMWVIYTTLLLILNEKEKLQ